MRIAIFSETFLPKWDGVANTLCHLLRHLADRGHTAIMFAPEGAPKRFAETPIHGLSCFPCPMYPPLKLVFPQVNVVDQLREFAPDVVHLVNPALLGPVGLRHGRELDVPVVASYHTDIPGYAQHYGLGLFRETLWAYFRWMHNGADLNLCPSRFTQEELEQKGFKRLRVWGRGVDTDRYTPRKRSGEWRDRLSGGRPDAQLLLYVGRLATEKRVAWLRPILDVLPEARLAIVGDGPERETLAKLFEGTNTVFTGYLEGEALASAYAAADIFTFPSASETFGNVVLEAMASGLPVIAPDAGGPRDHVHDGKNGYLFPAHDPEALVRRVRRLAARPGLIRSLGWGARAYAKTQTWEMILDGLIADYQAAIDAHAESGSPVSEGTFARWWSTWRQRGVRTTPPARRRSSDPVYS